MTDYKFNGYDFTLSKIIMERNEFTGGIVYGAQRLGKTVYSLKVAFDIFRPMATDAAEAWDLVFEHLFFKLDDIVSFLKEKIKNNEKAPIILWDDAGVHANKLVYFTDTTFAQTLQNLFDVVGIATRGILLTTPVPGNLLKSLRDYEFYKIKISKKDSDHQRIAKGYFPNLLPSGKVFVKTGYEDSYSKLLPNDIYQRYSPIRQQYLIEALDNLEKVIEQRNLAQCVKDAEMKELKALLEIKSNA